jgi:hypothetical protein
MQKITIIFFIAVLFSCSNNQATTGNNKPSPMQVTTSAIQPLQIDNSEEGWGGDINLSIIEKTENDTTHIYKAVSSYEGKELGLLVIVPKRKEGNKGFSQGITLKSIGVPSDNLLRTLSQLYKQTPYNNAAFTNSISVTYVNLKEFAKSVTGQEGQYTVANEYKLFFEGNNDEDYAELYLNINPAGNWIELREKDEECRPAVLRFLSK